MWLVTQWVWITGWMWIWNSRITLVHTFGNVNATPPALGESGAVQCIGYDGRDHLGSWDNWHMHHARALLCTSRYHCGQDEIEIRTKCSVCGKQPVFSLGLMGETWGRHHYGDRILFLQAKPTCKDLENSDANLIHSVGLFQTKKTPGTDTEVLILPA